MIHGLCCNARQWRYQIAHFSRAASVVAVDLLGHGGSAATQLQHSFDAFAADELVEDLVQLYFRYAGTTNYLLCHSYGCSLGALLAVRLAAAKGPTKTTSPSTSSASSTSSAAGVPPSLPSLAGSDAVFGYGFDRIAFIAPIVKEPLFASSGSRFLTFYTPPAVTSLFQPMIFKSFMRSAFGPDAPREMVDEAVTEARKMPMSVVHAVSYHLRVLDEPTLARLDVPMLVLVGEFDRLTPAETDAAVVFSWLQSAHERRSTSLYFQIPAAGHIPHLENPTAVNTALEQFFLHSSGVGAAAGHGAGNEGGTPRRRPHPLTSSTHFAASLRSTTVGDEIAKKETRLLVDCATTDSVGEVLIRLATAEITSLPLRSRELQRHTALVDVVDIAFAFVQAVTVAQGGGGEGGSAGVGGGETTLAAAKSVLAQPVLGIANRSARNPYMPVQESAPLLSAMQLMAKWRVRRLPVVSGADGTLTTVLSASRLIDALYERLASCEVRDATLFELSLGSACTVHSVPKTATVFEACATLARHAVSAVAVVEPETGKLIGNFSASDLKAAVSATVRLRAVTPQNLDPMAAWLTSLASLSLSDWLAADGSSSASPVRRLGLPLTVGPTSTLSAVVELLAERRVHRVYVVDAEGRAIGVVSQVDVLRCVALGE
jgi:pimeloyl-ACP methyl ester carboxylesterase/CBS domain-containing protein